MPKPKPSPSQTPTRKVSSQDAFLATVNDPLRANLDRMPALGSTSGLGLSQSNSAPFAQASPVRPNADLSTLMKLLPPSPLGTQNIRQAPASPLKAAPPKSRTVKDRFGYMHVFAPNGKVKIFDQHGVPKTIADVQQAMKRQAPPTDAGRNPFMEGLKTVPGELYHESGNALNGLSDFFGNTIGNAGEYVGNRVLEGQGYLNNNMDQVRQAQQGQRKNVAALTGIGKQVTPGTFVDVASGLGSVAGGDKRTGLHTITTIPSRNFQALKEDPQQWALNFVAVASMGAAGVLGKAAALEGESARVAKLGQASLASQYANRAAALRKIGNVMTAKPVTNALKIGARSVGSVTARGARTVGNATGRLIKGPPAGGPLTHWTNPDAAASILDTRKLSAANGAYGLSDGYSSPNRFVRALQTQAKMNVTEPVHITGPGAETFERVPVIGPFSWLRRTLGHREAPFGTVNIDTGEVTPEIWDPKLPANDGKVGKFRPTTPEDLKAYQKHKFKIDYAQDTALYSGLGALAGVGLYRNYLNQLSDGYDTPIVMRNTRQSPHAQRRASPAVPDSRMRRK